jgi:hypothetical protein
VFWERALCTAGRNVRWSEYPTWIKLHDPTTGEWHEVKAEECLPGVVETANKYRKKGGVLYAAIEKTSLGPEAQLEVLGGYLNDYPEDLEITQRFIEKVNVYKALERGGEQFV